MSTTFQHECEFSLDLAERCGKIALDALHAGLHLLATEEKPDAQGPVTKIDRELDTMIVRELQRAFPGDGVIAEESGVASEMSDVHASRCWFIDPIDGTTDFSQGDPGWAIHIGLAIDGQPAFGVVHEPLLARTSWGMAQGERREAWTRSSGVTRPLGPLEVGGLRLVSSKNHRSPRIDAIAALLSIGGDAHDQIGSTGVKIARVARGAASLFIHPTGGTKAWDTCAPQALLRGAGGQLTDLWGAPLLHDPTQLSHRRGLLATSGLDHAQIVERLTPLSRTWFTE